MARMFTIHASYGFAGTDEEETVEIPDEVHEDEVKGWVEAYVQSYWEEMCGRLDCSAGEVTGERDYEEDEEE